MSGKQGHVAPPVSLMRLVKILLLRRWVVEMFIRVQRMRSRPKNLDQREPREAVCFFVIVGTFKGHLAGCGDKLAQGRVYAACMALFHARARPFNG